MIVLVIAAALAAAEPSWWAEPPHPDGQLVGIGAGADAETARQRAIADLVESLVVDVSSRRRVTTTEVTVDGAAHLSDTFDQELKTSSAIRDLPGLILTAQAADAGVFYAQVRVAEALLLPELARRCATLAPTYLPRPTPPTWAWAAAARREMTILRERERLAAILTSRGMAAPVAVPDAARMIADLGVLAATSDVLLSGAAGPVLESVGTALGHASLAQSAAANLRLDVSTTSLRSRTERGWHQVQLTVTIDVHTPAGTVLGQLPCAVSGTSTKDAAGADQAALGRLGPALDTLFSDQLLPLLLTHHLE